MACCIQQERMEHWGCRCLFRIFALLMGFVIYQICKYKMVLFYFWLGEDMRDRISIFSYQQGWKCYWTERPLAKMEDYSICFSFYHVFVGIMKWLIMGFILLDSVTKCSCLHCNRSDPEIVTKKDRYDPELQHIKSSNENYLKFCWNIYRLENFCILSPVHCLVMIKAGLIEKSHYISWCWYNNLNV